MRRRSTGRSGIGTALALIVIPALAAACDQPPDLPADAVVRYDTVGGVVHVVSGSRGAWVRGGSWSVPDSGVVIGVADGDPDRVLGEVADVLVGEGGRIYVADTQAKEIRVFGPDGAFLRRIGREGAGPGEFRNISGLVRAPDGIAALDGGLGRVTIFSPEGRVVRWFRLERPYMVFAYDAPIAFDGRGRFLDRTDLSSRPLVDSIAVIRYSPEGKPVDTALIAAVEEDQLVITRDGRPVMSFDRPYAPKPSLAFGPDGTILFARGDAYRIDVLSPAGDTLRVLRRELRPRPVSDEERETALTRVAERFEAAGQPPPAGVEIPGTHPAIREIRVDRAGNVWALTAANPRWTTLEWSVHDPDGRYLGAVATPVMNVMDIGEDYVAGVTTDDLGVPRVRIVPIRK